MVYAASFCGEILIQKRLSQILQYEDLPAAAQHRLDTVHNTLTATQVIWCFHEASHHKGLWETWYRYGGFLDLVRGDAWPSNAISWCLLCKKLQGIPVIDIQFLAGLMAYDNHDYGRWFPDYWAMFSTLPNEKMTFISNHFVQSMTGLHHTCQPLDLWIETTMNSKLKQWWMRILHNKQFLQQQGMQTPLQEWRLLCSRTSNASIFIWSMLSVSHWGWRRVGKQFMTSRHPCMILMLIPLASFLQHWGHCSLDWSPYQDLCKTPRLQ